MLSTALTQMQHLKGLNACEVAAGTCVKSWQKLFEIKVGSAFSSNLGTNYISVIGDPGGEAEGAFA